MAVAFIDAVPTMPTLLVVHQVSLNSYKVRYCRYYRWGKKNGIAVSRSNTFRIYGMLVSWGGKA